MDGTEDDGFMALGYKVEGFSAACGECGSNQIGISVSITEYGEWTGAFADIGIECRACGNSFST